MCLGQSAPAFAVTAILFQPLVATLDHGQFYAVRLALLAVVWHGYRTSRDLAVGGPLGILLITKTAGLLIWPLLVLERRWRALAWSVGVPAVTALMAWPWIGALSCVSLRHGSAPRHGSGVIPVWRTPLTLPWILLAAMLVAAVAAPAHQANALNMIGRFGVGLAVFLLTVNGAMTTRVRGVLVAAAAAGAIVSSLVVVDYLGVGPVSAGKPSSP